MIANNANLYGCRLFGALITATHVCGSRF